MPNWNAVLQEINEVKQQLANANALDIVRRNYLKQLHAHTGRNVIAYYSAWLQRGPNTPNLSISDTDKNALMATIHGMDRELGLDLILHTPGGSIAAAESIVDYLRRMFGNNEPVLRQSLLKAKCRVPDDWLIGSRRGLLLAREVMLELKRCI